MKEYKLKSVIEDYGLLDLKFENENNQVYGVYLISSYKEVNKEALKMLQEGIILLIEGKHGDSLEDLCCRGIRNIYIKNENGNMPLYITKENNTKSTNLPVDTKENSDNTLLS